MYRTPGLNADGMPLEADHTLARSLGGTKADRLMLATCNRSRGDGQRPITGGSDTPTWWTRDWFGNVQVTGFNSWTLRGGGKS
jgi:hypothetical protein